MLSKLPALGPFADEWQQSYEEIAKDVEEVDITNALSTAAMAVKDEKELVSWFTTYSWLYSDISACYA